MLKANEELFEKLIPHEVEVLLQKEIIAHGDGNQDVDNSKLRKDKTTAPVFQVPNNCATQVKPREKKSN